MSLAHTLTFSVNVSGPGTSCSLLVELGWFLLSTNSTNVFLSFRCGSITVAGMSSGRCSPAIGSPLGRKASLADQLSTVCMESYFWLRDYVTAIKNGR